MFQAAHEDPTAEPWPWNNTALQEHRAVTPLPQTQFPQ